MTTHTKFTTLVSLIWFRTKSYVNVKIYRKLIHTPTNNVKQVLNLVIYFFMPNRGLKNKTSKKK